MRKTIKEGLGLDESQIQFERVHRNPPGPRKIGVTRAIIAKFSFFKDRMNIWSQRKNLSGNTEGSDPKITMAEDFPEEIQKRRQLLKPILNAAKSIPKYTDGSYLSVDRLIINSQVYTVSNLNTLPSDLDPAKIATQTKENIT